MKGRERWPTLTLLLGIGLFIAFLPSRSLASQGSLHTHDGWVKHTVFERFGVTTTEARIQQTYSQDSSSVCCGIFVNNIKNSYCAGSHFPDWHIHSCWYWLDPAPNNKDYMGINILADMHYHGPRDYHYIQRAYNVAWSTDQFFYDCWIDSGQLPSSWTTGCIGGRLAGTGGQGGNIGVL